MKKLSFTEFCDIRAERATAIHEGANLPHLKGVIVYSESNWPYDHYSLGARSYRTSSDEKYFGYWYNGRSLFANSLDGSDFARLDYFPNWKIDYCYIEE